MGAVKETKYFAECGVCGRRSTKRRYRSIRDALGGVKHRAGWEMVYPGQEITIEGRSGLAPDNGYVRCPDHKDTNKEQS